MNGIAIINKPEGITSHGVVSRVRRIFGTRRVGHSGTLDPMATGVLPVFVGRATRACEFAICDDKAYTARLRLGVRTDTQDITGKVISESPVSVTDEEFCDVCRRFTGKISQIPPMYSAIKSGGVPLYKLAREGKSAERAPREIEIRKITPRRIAENEFEIDVECSKGTYIRTLIDDIGNALSCGAAMTALCRTRSGMFLLKNAKTLEELSENPVLLPLDTMFLNLPSKTIDASGEKKCRNGADVPSDAEEGAEYRVYSENGEFLMIARGAKDGALITVKSFFEV